MKIVYFATVITSIWLHAATTVGQTEDRIDFDRITDAQLMEAVKNCRDLKAIEETIAGIPLSVMARHAMADYRKTKKPTTRVSFGHFVRFGIWPSEGFDKNWTRLQYAPDYPDVNISRFGKRYTRDWADVSGRFKVKAQLYDVNSTTVSLKRDVDGKIIKVPLDRLAIKGRSTVKTFQRVRETIARRIQEASHQTAKEELIVETLIAQANARKSKVAAYKMRKSIATNKETIASTASGEIIKVPNAAKNTELLSEMQKHPARYDKKDVCIGGDLFVARKTEDYSNILMLAKQCYRDNSTNEVLTDVILCTKPSTLFDSSTSNLRFVLDPSIAEEWYDYYKKFVKETERINFQRNGEDGSIPMGVTFRVRTSLKNNKLDLRVIAFRGPTADATAHKYLPSGKLRYVTVGSFDKTKEP